MGINKVQYGNTTLIDLTGDTVTADKLMQGYTAHDRSGAVITGTATGGGTGAISVVDTTDTHGGTIRTITAVDISDTTAVASDVAQGKYFYTADGTKTEGTSTGGGGGLEYETGTWTPSEDVARPTINFVNTHSAPPLLVMMADATGTDDQTAYSNYGFVYSSFYSYTGQGVPSNETNNRRYALAGYVYRQTGNPSQGVSGITNLTGSTSSAVEYWVSNTGFLPYSASESRYWWSNRTYKWIAIWAPTT